MNKFAFLLLFIGFAPGCTEQANAAGGKIAAWGDSFTYGGGISLPEFAYPVQLQNLSGWQVYNGGINGETSTQIKTRMLAATDKQKYSAIIWAGNNNYSQPETVKADIAQMVAFLGHKRFLVISLLNGQTHPAGTPEYATIIKLNNDLKNIYGKNYLDVRSYLVSQSDGSPQDERDKAMDVVPTSLRWDSSHPNDKGYKFVAEYINKNLALLTVPLTVTPDTKTKPYGSPDPALTYSYSGTLESGDSFTGTLSRSTGENAGTYSISQNTLTAGGYYSISYTPANFTITKVALTITAANVTRVEGRPNPTFTANYTGFVNGETSSMLTSPPTFSTTATASSTPGNYPITVSGAVALNYNISYVPGTLSVTPSPPVISSFTPTTSATGATVTITGNYFTGATAVSFGGTPAASFSVVSPTSITAVVGAGASGNVSVTTPRGTGTLSAFTFQKPLTVTAVAKSKVYGSPDPIFTYTVTGTLDAGDSFTGSLSRTPGTNVGTYAITQGTLSAGSNYTITYVPANLTISKAPLTITADNKTKAEGATNPALTASYAGFVNGETSSVLTVQPVLTTTAVATSATGSYPITASGAAALNYNIGYVPGTLTVTPAPPAIASFTPTTSASGATVIISGNYFTGATALSFGGTPAASFSVTSPTSITAVVGAGASGNVSVTTSVGTGTLAGYTFVPKPTIAAGGQTTFASGGSVVLTASPGTGFTYKWAKDGVDIAGAVAPSYMATAMGSYTVTITANSISQTSTPIAVNSVFVLPANNFRLTATNETCKASNNGSINILATQAKSYTTLLIGNSLNVSKPFTTTVDFTGLQAGTYNVCITVAGEAAYKQCFDIVITEPKDLSVFAVVNKDGNSISLALDGNTDYLVELNGKLFKTNQSNLTLDLKPGGNILKVSTATFCQGSFEKHITLFDKPVVYPNPFEDLVNLSGLPFTKTSIEISSLNGIPVLKQTFNNETGTIALNLGSLNAGTYILKASAAGFESIYKIIKR